MVRIFFDCETLTEIAFHDRAIAPSADNPRIVGRDSPTSVSYTHLDVYKRQLVGCP